jgi:hypothetical protein
MEKDFLACHSLLDKESINSLELVEFSFETLFFKYSESLVFSNFSTLLEIPASAGMTEDVCFLYNSQVIYTSSPL